MSAWDDATREPGDNIHTANKLLAPLGVKLTPMAELYANLVKVFDERGKDLGEALELLAWSGARDYRHNDYPENLPFYERLDALFEKYDLA